MSKLNKIEYDKMLFAWENYDISILRHLRNSSIGTLLKDINNGVDIETAVRKYEEIVAPYNYKRPKAIFTKKMLEDAKKTVEKLSQLSHYAHSSPISDGMHGVATSGETKKPRGRKP